MKCNEGLTRFLNHQVERAHGVPQRQSVFQPFPSKLGAPLQPIRLFVRCVWLAGGSQ